MKTKTLNLFPGTPNNLFQAQPFYPNPMFLLYYAQSTNLVPERFVENACVGYRLTGGEIIVPPQYEEGSKFHNGHAIVVKNKRKGFINTFGKIIIPLIYEDVTFF